MNKDTKYYWIATNILLALIYLRLIGIQSLKDAETALNGLFEQFVSYLQPVLFFDVSFSGFDIGEHIYSGNGFFIGIVKEGKEVVEKIYSKTALEIPLQEVTLPLIVLVLLVGVLIFSFYFKFINVRGFKHSINVTMGKYDNPDDIGQISHFQALTSALSATIGLGNIAGVGAALSMGGAGAVFWMIFVAFFSMSAKFVSCTLGQLYRKVNDDGSVSGGPMYYLKYGLKERGFTKLGKILGAMYAVFIIGGAFGGGNMFQANQSYALVGQLIGINGLAYAIILVILVSLVIFGGIKRIGQTTSAIVPAMVTIYVIASLFIIFSNYEKLPFVITSIFKGAFTYDAFWGGFVGVLVIGITRAVFSNEGGVGSASIAHSAAKTNEPVREGIVAMIGPFIDTIVVCLMTACVILIAVPEYLVGGSGVEGLSGALLTQKAFSTLIPGFEYVLTIVVFLFSYSTMISWYYYGDKGWKYLMGDSKINLYKSIYLGCIVLGCVGTLDDVMSFSDMMILSCAFPNIIGCMFLLPVVKRHLDEYWGRYQAGKFKTYK